MNREEAKKIYLNKKIKTKSEECMNAITFLVKEFTKLNPYNEQIKAARYIYEKEIAEMYTGEGKTLSILIAALMVHRENHKIYIITSNDYLSNRDFEYSKEIFTYLNINSVHFSEDEANDKTYSDNEIIYATPDTLIFDYLRGIKAEYDFAIIDEIDYVLVECSNEDFSVGSSEIILPIDESLFRQCNKFVQILNYKEIGASCKPEEKIFDYQYKYDYLVDLSNHQIMLTDLGYKKISDVFSNPSKLYKNTTFFEVLMATLEARHFYLNGINYIVKNNKLIMINQANGRIKENGQNEAYMVTAAEINENIPISEKTLFSNTCSFPIFFSLFKYISGLSGTASMAPYDFEIIYKKNVYKIPTHFPNQRKEHYMYFENDEKRLESLCYIIENNNGPFLIITDSDARNKIIEKKLKNENISNVFNLCNENLEHEIKLIDKATQKNNILISNKIVGRGVDITVPDEIKDGLTVIIAQRFLSRRTERQAIGRTGRNGKAGNVYILSSKDDLLCSYEPKKIKTLNEKKIMQLQNIYEALQFDARKHTYIRNKLFFDQDNALRNFFKQLKSFEDILNFCNNITMKRKENKKALNKATNLATYIVKNNGQFNDFHRDIMIRQYERIHLIYQQQFIYYNNYMMDTLINPMMFTERCKEYVETGREILLEIINNTLLPIVKQMEKNKRKDG